MEETIKIAAVTDDGKVISRHFGRAAHYMVVTVEDGKITRREMREKPGHAQFRGEADAHREDPGGRHGYGSAADHRHRRMAEAITYCEAV